MGGSPAGAPAAMASPAMKPGSPGLRGFAAPAPAAAPAPVADDPFAAFNPFK